MDMKSKRIAVVGGGASGASAAWLLSTVHQVTLYEPENKLGGHAFTFDFEHLGGTTPVDMGVEYFNERLSPNLFAMHELFGLETYVTPLSFRAHFSDGAGGWSNVTIDGAVRRELADEMGRFHLDMAMVFARPKPEYSKFSIGDFIRANGYSNRFATHGLLPLMTTFSGCDAPSLDYNLMYVAISFNMNLLSFYSPSYWRKSKGGITSYLSKIAEALGDRVRTGCAVESVIPLSDGSLRVETVQGADVFDAVVFATHSDVTLQLLKRPTRAQQDILQRFAYVPVRSVLHRDTKMALGGGSGEYCEFALPKRDGEVAGEHGQLTRVIRNLPGHERLSEDVFVTFDPKQDVAPEKIIIEKRWKLPQLRPQDFYQKAQFRNIQGRDGLWYCGTDTSYTGHEGAIVSGMVVATRLGARYPFSGNALASIQYRLIKDLMGVRRTSETPAAAAASVIANATRRFSLHKKLAHHFVGDMIF
jgi:uncharacterized protein